MRVDGRGGAGSRGGADAEDTLRPVSDVVCTLGEGPTWDASAGVAHWVDIDRGVPYEAPVGAGAGAGERVDVGTERVGPTRSVLTVDGTLGAAVQAVGGGFLLAASRHLEHRDASIEAIGDVDLGGRAAGLHLCWQLPPGVTPGAIQWPLPEKLPGTPSNRRPA